MTDSHKDPIVIVSAARTPIGGLLGDLSPLSAPELGTVALRAAIERAGVKPEDIDETIMGCVLTAGMGQAPARQAALGAGIPASKGATTINKMCGSGLKAVMLAHDQILAGSAQVMAAGGMESMSNAPHLLKARAGVRMGDAKAVDHMMIDGLEDAYEKGRPMGAFAELCAQKYGFTREAQDLYALESLNRALTADMAAEIFPVTVKAGRETKSIERDEQPLKARPDKIPTLKPAFAPDGTITAANASSISDGAAALILMKRSEAERRGLAPLARIAGHATYAKEPAWFTTAPVGALRELSGRLAWDLNAVDLFEINEAFAVVPMAAIHDLDLPRDKVNVNGGACALGHPIGASGARVLVTLLHAMQKRQVRRGMAALCIGGGEAVAMAMERF